MRLAILSCLLFCGCAVSHRAAVSTHVHREFVGRSDGKIVEDVWTDKDHGGGSFLFTDPDVQSLVVCHTNQAALGGGSLFSAGPMSLKVDPELVPAIKAGGEAIGKVIGEALKSAAGAP